MNFGLTILLPHSITGLLSNRLFTMAMVPIIFFFNVLYYFFLGGGLGGQRKLVRGAVGLGFNVTCSDWPLTFRTLIAFPPLATERPPPSHPEGTLSTTLGVSFTGHWPAHTFPTLRGFHTLGSFLYWPLTGPHLPHTRGLHTLGVSFTGHWPAHTFPTLRSSR